MESWPIWQWRRFSKWWLQKCWGSRCLLLERFQTRWVIDFYAGNLHYNANCYQVQKAVQETRYLNTVLIVDQVVIANLRLRKDIQRCFSRLCLCYKNIMLSFLIMALLSSLGPASVIWGTKAAANKAAAESASMAFWSFPIWAKEICRQDLVQAFSLLDSPKPDS